MVVTRTARCVYVQDRKATARAQNVAKLSLARSLNLTANTLTLPYRLSKSVASRAMREKCGRKWMRGIGTSGIG